MRALYVESERIVIARIGKTEVTKVENGNGEIELYSLKTALLVSSTLKGEPQPGVYVNHMMYRDYKDQISSATEGETFLIFLTRREADKGYYIENMSYGLKQLSEADLKVYVSRIEELASIMKAEKPSDEEIVEWLVRCSEEPATRWEGAYELAMSNYMRQTQEPTDENAPSDSSVEISENQAAETPVEEISLDEVEDQNLRIRDAAPIKANFLKLLTTEQKYRLTTALINGEIITDRDDYLIDVVRTWDDPRLVPYLLAQLDLVSRPGKSDQTSSYFTEKLITIVADKLGDDALKAMVKKFSGNDYEQAEMYEDEDEEAASEENEEVTETTSEREAADEAAAVQQRSAELQYFVTLALSTVPKTPTAEPANPVISAEP